MINANNIEPSDYRALKVMKKPIVVTAIQMPDDFIVEAMEGVEVGKKGDYLIIGARGEKYPIDREIFLETYNIVEVRK